MFLALRQDLIGTTIKTDKGDFAILALEDYDSMTHLFTLKVKNISDNSVTTREFSDKTPYEILEEQAKNYPNDKRLNPRRV